VATKTGLTQSLISQIERGWESLKEFFQEIVPEEDAVP